MKVQVKGPRVEVTLDQAKRWFARNGFTSLGGVSVDSIGFLHGEYREVVLLPLDGCYKAEIRVGSAIEEAAEMIGRHAIDILREMSEVTS